MISSAVLAQPVIRDSGRMEKIRSARDVIEKIYTDFAAANHFPGMVYGVMVDGKMAFSGSTGFANLEGKIAAGSKTAFRIASMSKSFTTMAILQLRDAGKLRLDDPASQYIPEMKGLKLLTGDAPAITIRHLMIHAAGLPEDNPWGDRQLADSDQELLALVKGGLSFSNVPGIKYEYSNLGFTLLGRIITRVSGLPYQQYISQKIFRPLGMNHTYWEYDQVPAKDLAHGYRWIRAQYAEEALLHDGSYGAMGGIITTLEDFSKYLALHQSAWPPANDLSAPVIRKSSLREMQQPWMFNNLNPNYRYPGSTKACPLVASYGYGLRWTSDCAARVTVGHSGGLPGFGSNWFILPDYGIGLICFANRTYAPASVVNMKVMDTLLTITGLKAFPVKPSVILEQKKKELAAFLPDWKNAEASKLFAENFFPDYPIDLLREESRALFSKAGRIIRVSEMKAENQLRGSFILEGEKTNLEVSFTLTPENPPRIQEYHIREIR